MSRRIRARRGGRRFEGPQRLVLRQRAGDRARTPRRRLLHQPCRGRATGHPTSSGLSARSRSARALPPRSSRPPARCARTRPACGSSTARQGRPPGASMPTPSWHDHAHGRPAPRRCRSAPMPTWTPTRTGSPIRGDWSAPGSPSIVGHYSLADFGKLAVARLGAGLPLIVNDNLAELAPEEAATFQSIGIAATICMPLVKEGRLTALMAIHDKVPRDLVGDGTGDDHRGHRTLVGPHRTCSCRGEPSARVRRNSAPSPRRCPTTSGQRRPMASSTGSTTRSTPTAARAG